MAVRCPRCGEALVVEVRRFRGGRKPKKVKRVRLRRRGQPLGGASSEPDPQLMARRREKKASTLGTAPAGDAGSKAGV
jgi:hypothetical protein